MMDPCISFLETRAQEFLSSELDLKLYASSSATSIETKLLAIPTALQHCKETHTYNLNILTDTKLFCEYRQNTNFQYIGQTTENSP